MPISWLEHKGKNILYVDYRGQTGADLIKTLEAAYKTVTKARGKTLVLDDFTGAVLDSAFMARAKELGTPKGERKSGRTAAIGVGGLKPILLSGYNIATGAGIMPFDTREEALEWLVEEKT